MENDGKWIFNITSHFVLLCDAGKLVDLSGLCKGSLAGKSWNSPGLFLKVIEGMDFPIAEAILPEKY